MKVVVTGAAGFIGSNIILGLNRLGIDDVIAVDDLTDGQKFMNLRDLRISDYLDRQEFYSLFARQSLGKIAAVFHQGACSDTMEHNGRFMFEANYSCSKNLLDACTQQHTRLFYASSASVYGDSTVFREEPRYERPLNVYGYSKLLFDQVVRRYLPGSDLQVVGLRYFNVYGPRERHKGRMASVAMHNFDQFEKDATVRLFGEYGGYEAGGQQRDFVFVDDVVAVNLWFLEHPEARGIFNLGTGRAQPFNDVAQAIVNAHRRRSGQQPGSLSELVAQGAISYIPFPGALHGKYQCFTQADLTQLRAAGCDIEFSAVESGVRKYADWLASNKPL
jgi:ADP-L-glycero-D-manno-heptose 6-epimerase